MEENQKGTEVLPASLTGLTTQPTPETSAGSVLESVDFEDFLEKGDMDIGDVSVEDEMMTVDDELLMSTDAGYSLELDEVPAFGEMDLPEEVLLMMTDFLQTQNDLNVKFIGKDWRERSGRHSYIDYCPAILEEAVELMNCNMRWKFWKSLNTLPDYSNMALEFIDLLHFGMSEAMAQEPSLPIKDIAWDMTFWYCQAFGVSTGSATDSTGSFPTPPGYNYLKVKKSLFAYLSSVFFVHSTTEAPEEAGGLDDQLEDIPNPLIDWASFWAIPFSIGVGLNKIHAIYKGKALLNAFRIENGDKVGNYSRHWFDGKEDNFHMMTFLDSLLAKNPGSLVDEAVVSAWIRDTYAKFKLEERARLEARYEPE